MDALAPEILKNRLLNTVAFIAGKKNPAIQKKIIRFSIEFWMLSRLRNPFLS